MTAYTSNPLLDPDAIDYIIGTSSDFDTMTEEMLIDTTNRRIFLKVTGNLTTDGAILKSVYSRLKDAWREDSELIKFPFPMGPITDEQFEMINGWNWDKAEESGSADQTTPELLRTGGWSVVGSGGSIEEEWINVITLGILGSTDQVYYQQVDEDEPSVDFILTGPVNQAIQTFSAPLLDDFSRRTYLKIFVREWQKIYGQSEIADIGVSTLTFQAYRFPLTTADDLNVTKDENEIDDSGDGIPDQGVYENITITYLRDANDDFYRILGDYDDDSFAYEVGDVVRDTSDDRWYKNILAYTSDSTNPSDNATNWESYEGERLVGTTYYPFTVIIDADTTVNPTESGDARISEVYEAIQYLLRQEIDIDSNPNGSVTGKTAAELLTFVGDNLVTSQGVYIDSFNAQDTNNITLTTFTGAGTSTTVNFPFVAALTVNFGDNLQADQFARYWVFFTNAGGNEFGTTDAIIVEDNESVPMEGSVNPNWPTSRSNVTHSFDYDNNTQGGRTGNTDAPITAVAIGLQTGQYVLATSTITRSTANSVTLVSALERNYESSANSAFPPS
jgi:hypothetical protein